MCLQDFNDVYVHMYICTYVCLHVRGYMRTCIHMYVYDCRFPFVTCPEPPVIVGGPSEVAVISGRPIRLQCNNTGQPRPSIVWIKDNLELEIGGRVFIDPLRGQLEILNATRSDSGSYICRAINDLGATSYSVKVVVRGQCSLLSLWCP